MRELFECHGNIVTTTTHSYSNIMFSFLYKPNFQLTLLDELSK